MEQEMDKLERDGEVAVVYSPGYGAGWSTWDGGDHRDFLCMDKGIAQAVLAGDIEAAKKIALARVPTLYTGGANQLCIEWVPKGRPFEITEYDGFEGVRLVGPADWMVA